MAADFRKTAARFVRAFDRPIVASVLFVLITACVGAGCGKHSPTAPSTDSLTGNWAGASSGYPAGQGSIAFSLTQSGSSVSGTWTALFAEPAYNDAGSATGRYSNGSLALTLTSSQANACPYTLTATVTNASTMSGTYAAFNCSIAAGGTFSATKQ
jgi:hypothetical protein